MARLPWLVLLAMLAGCPSKDAEQPEPEAIAQQFAKTGAIVRKHDNTQVAWTVDEHGNIKAALRDRDGKAITTGVKGEVSWKTQDGKEQTAKLVPNTKTGLLEADAVPLPDDATEVSYSLEVNGANVAGSLPLPQRTATTPTEASASASAPPTPPAPAPVTSAPNPTPAPSATVSSKSGRTTEGSDRFPPRAPASAPK